MPRMRITNAGQVVAMDAPRPPARQLRSTAAWTRAARAQVQREPQCEECGATTDLTADHVVPLADGGPLLGRLRTLCRRHNSAKGARR